MPTSATPHRFDVYGRYVVEVVREDDRWLIYRLGEGTRRLLPEARIPPDTRADELATALDDLWHELARPGQQIRRIHASPTFEELVAEGEARKPSPGD